MVILKCAFKNLTIESKVKKNLLRLQRTILVPTYLRLKKILVGPNHFI